MGRATVYGGHAASSAEPNVAKCGEGGLMVGLRPVSTSGPVKPVTRRPSRP